MPQPLDAHARAPDAIRDVYKKYRHMPAATLQQDPNIIDFERKYDALKAGYIKPVFRISARALETAYRAFSEREESDEIQEPLEDLQVYECAQVPGLLIIPHLLAPRIQYRLLSTLLHTALSDPINNTNVHAHHHITYPPPRYTPSSSSFFTLHPTTTPPFAPKDPAIHSPLSFERFLRRSLRWITLGGQYDWTLKRYPSPETFSNDDDEAGRPRFPPDVANLLRPLFPYTTPQAAIVNLYSPGDVLSPHRDVAETVGAGLVSVSLGCAGVFVVGCCEAVSEGAGAGERGGEGKGGTGEGRKGLGECVTLRLRSGDAVYMSGQARWAWHGIPTVEAGTCPEYLADWPANSKEDAASREEDGKNTIAGEQHGDRLEEWRGWMAGKRVNLNVRQID